MHSSIRFQHPVSMTRPRGERVIEAYSPKLGRRLQCFGQNAFHQWICLEADPSISVFCERPVFINLAQGKRLVDFWIRRGEHEMLLLLSSDYALSSAELANITLPISVIPAIDHVAARTWINNWERILPVMTSCRGIASASLGKSILQFISEPMPLSRIEQEFVTGDPSLVRSTVFCLLHQGRLQAPQLRTEPLSFMSRFQPAEAMP